MTTEYPDKNMQNLVEKIGYRSWLRTPNDNRGGH